MLHITNGDTAVETLASGGVAGDILPWRDVLHDGPVPADVSLDELSRVRARFIADCGWGEFEDVVADFESRDRTLTSFGDHGEVTLWFEHDLYDQLQLIQLLDYFANQDLGSTRLSIVLTDSYLGTVSPAEVRSLWASRTGVTPGQFGLAREAWRTFRAPDPSDLQALCHRDTNDLPYLGAALRRHLEQFPWVGSGLSRIEAQAFAFLAKGRTTIREAFPASHHRVEDPIWLGDGVFVWYLEGLSTGRLPLLRLGPEPADPLAREVWLTEAGQAVAEGRADRVTVNGLERWLGGVRLSGTHVAWRWNPRSERLERTL